MALYGHIAVGMVSIVVIEPHREIVSEGIDAPLSHQLWPLALNQRIEGKFQLSSIQLENHADLHRNHVKHPGAVLHLSGKSPQALDIIAPHTPSRYTGLHRSGYSIALAKIPSSREAGSSDMERASLAIT